MVDIRDYRLDRIFGALANPTRRRILQGLIDGEATVGQIAAPYDISLAAVSKHLHVLERAELVERTVCGRVTSCRLVPEVLDEAVAALDYYRDFWNRRLDSLATHLDGEPDD